MIIIVRGFLVVVVFYFGSLVFASIRVIIYTYVYAVVSCCSPTLIAIYSCCGCDLRYEIWEQRGRYLYMIYKVSFLSCEVLCAISALMNKQMSA